jgi:hypothetical protein
MIFIEPNKQLVSSIRTLMLSKLFFEKYSSSIDDADSLKTFLESHFGIPVLFLDQVHSSRVVKVNKKHISLSNLEADALLTTESNMALAIKSADCLPLILCSEKRNEIAAVHVGWKGLQKGIIENTINSFKSDLDSIKAWIAPCISRNNYEVGKDVYDLFTHSDTESRKSFLAKEEKEKWLFGLKEECIRRLLKYDVNVISNRFCTYENSNLFYSYRRAKESSRMITLVWRQYEK